MCGKALPVFTEDRKCLSENFEVLPVFTENRKCLSETSETSYGVLKLGRGCYGGVFVLPDARCLSNTTGNVQCFAMMS